MKRILMILTVVLTMVAMVAVTAMPAFAFEFNASGKTLLVIRPQAKARIQTLESSWLINRG